ncbi:MAG: TIGR02921 family PEP-CTERM protein, partial [Anaerolineales bacterium]
DDPFSALAVRRLILAEMQRNRGTIQQIETLDALHALATQYGIVTPYSSMIVLVEADQQRLLDKLTNLEDRYQREVESLGDTAPSTPLPLAGVPEPHEWLLLGLAAALLVYLIYTKRRQNVLVSR